jgi:2-iminobutanoate/2-iminopropanoate deaminase
MDRNNVNAPQAPVASGGYAHGVAVINARRTLYISGQIPMTEDGVVPKDLEEQSGLTWPNREAQLIAAGMTLNSLAKVTTFVSDRQYADKGQQPRQDVRKDHASALRVVTAGIFDAIWLLEIEAIACV